MAERSITIQMAIKQILPYFASFVRKQANIAYACHTAHSSNCIAPSLLEGVVYVIFKKKTKVVYAIKTEAPVEYAMALSSLSSRQGHHILNCTVLVCYALLPDRGPWSLEASLSQSRRIHR